MPGVATWNFGEAFAHLYLDSVAMNHNAIGRGYETFGNGTAETLRADAVPGGDLARVVSRAAAAGDALLWSARDNVNYNETGALAALDYAAAQFEDAAAQFLLARAATRWRKGVEEPPYAFVIPAGPGRSDARGAAGGAPAVAAHRGASRECGHSR